MGFRLGHAVGVPEAFQRSVEFTYERELCFLSHPSSCNYKIRSLVTTPYVLSYWKNVVDQIDWKKVWILSSKYK